jgi:CobQ-like glutamine amidotransferase family enzyme
MSDMMSAAVGVVGANKPIDVLVLYPRDMNIYGDNGNILTVRRRLEMFGFEPVLHYYNQGDAWPEHVDIVLGGGGQDSGQGKIIDDFHMRREQLRALACEGVPMLVVCGLYQLFGHYFETLDGYRLEGIGVFDAYTLGRTKRLIGNIVEESSEFGTLVGFENHSGQTFINAAINAADSDDLAAVDDSSASPTMSGVTRPLAQVISGAGNNGEDGSEGSRVYNVIGTYLHGSLLPKNPRVADFLIQTAAERRYGENWHNVVASVVGQAHDDLETLDSVIEHARRVAMSRPR